MNAILNIFSSAIPVFVLLVIQFISAQIVNAEDQPFFQAGIINVTGIERPDVPGDSTIHWESRQRFATIEDDVFYRKLPGTLKEVTVLESGLDLKSQPYTEVLLRGEYTISKDKLTCSKPEDRCYGNFHLWSFYEGYSLDLDNVRLDDRDTYNRAYVNVLTHTEEPVTPEYTGDIVIRAPKGRDFTHSLADSINFSSGYTCTLLSPSRHTGLEVNPTAVTADGGEEVLKVGSLCSVEWLIGDAQSVDVGDQYNFLVKVQADDSAPGTNTRPYTILNLQIEIGCSDDSASTGDASCFLCQDVDPRPATQTISEMIAAKRKELQRARGKGVRLAQRQQGGVVGLPATRIRRAFRKVIEFFKNYQQLETTVLSLETQTQCFAASPEFCSSTSNLDSKQPLISLIQSSDEIGQRTFQAYKRLVVNTSGGRSRALKNANAQRDGMLRFLAEIEALATQVPDSADVCGDINL